MTPLAYLAPLLHGPLPAVIIGGLFAGAALSTATRRTRHKRDPQRAAARKWILACLSLSAAVVFGQIGRAHV